MTAEGGAMHVIKGKHWRDVGDAFHLPKTITSVSFVLKRGYMQYLWDYEQVYFHRLGGQPRVPAPVSRYTKDSGGGGAADAAAPASSGAKPSGLLSNVDTAAAMAVAALRCRYAPLPLFHCAQTSALVAVSERQAICRQDWPQAAAPGGGARGAAERPAQQAPPDGGVAAVMPHAATATSDAAPMRPLVARRHAAARSAALHNG